MALLSNLYPGIKGAQGIQGIQGTLGTQGTTGTQGIQGGEIKGFSVTEVNGPYSLQTSDVGNLIKINSGTSPVSISSNTFSFGNSFMVYNGTSNTQTISQGVGVSFYSGDGTATLGSKYINENEMATILCSSSNDEFIFSGAYRDIVKDGLVLLVDAGDPTSYPGSGTTWYDLVSEVNNGTLVNGVGYDGGNGGSLVFDGIDDEVQLPGTNLSLNQMTISSWNYSSNYQQNGFMFEKTTNGNVNTQYSLFYNSGNNSIYYRTYGLSTTDLAVNSTTAGVVNNQWNNVVATFDGTNKRIYVNGILRATSANLTGTVTQNSTGIALIGRHGNISDYPFNGRIAQTKIYNRALTSSEIEQNFEALKGRYGL